MTDRYFKVNAVVLKYSDFSESSRILTVFSAESGLMKISAKAARRKDSKSLSLTQPFAFCTYELCRGKNGIHTLVSGELVDNFYSLSRDIGRFSAAGDITAELLGNLVDGEAELSVFRLFLNTLFALAYTDKEVSLIRSVFTLRLKKELGFLPDPESLLNNFYENAGPEIRAMMNHIWTCDSGKLYGFTASEDLLNFLGSVSVMARTDLD